MQGQFNNGYSVRGNRNDLGGAPLALALLLVGLTALAVLGWSNLQAKAAQADLTRVTAERLRAELEAQIPFLPGVEAERAGQLIAQLRSEGLTREQMDRISREAMAFNEQMRQSKALADLAFKQGMYQTVIRLTYALGLALIVVPAGLITYVLFLNVRERAEDRAELRAEARAARAAARAAAAAITPPAPAAAPSRRPRPAAPAPATGRLPGLPQGQPRREPPQPAPAASQPAAQPASSPGLAVHTVQRPAQPGVTAVAGNGHAPTPNGNGHSNGIYGNGHRR